MLKDTLREIKSSLGRFFAIFAITIVGVAFFAGVTASSGDMKYSSDLYYDDYNLYDLRIVSNVGFTEDEVQKIKEVDGIDGFFATHTTDVICNIEGTQNTVRVMTVPDANLNSDNKDYINQLRIKEGRLPQKSGECVIRFSDFYKDSIQIGDKLTVSADKDNDILDTLKVTEFEIVGIVYTPYYVSYDIGQSDIGSGKVNFAMMIPNSDFVEEYYTEIFATVDSAKSYNTYSDDYFDCVGTVKEKIENIHDSTIQIRVDDNLKEIDRKKDEALDEAHQTIRKRVEEEITGTYQAFYPGIDVSNMVESMIESAVEESIKNFDTSEIDEYFDDLKKTLKESSADWEWYVLDRDSSYSFREYQSSADRMNKIAIVFPIFFILVAALVCLTTMTRMVDEQRELIGTYKALGYSKNTIAMKYIIYSFTASAFGGVIGCIAGLKLFPYIIYNCWNIIYYMPSIQYGDHYILSLVAILSMIAVIVLATIYACYNELSEVPSQLMRPKAPKKGKKIFLEHIGFIWKHLSFSSKVTARNLFRYKKRFFMTVVGVAGGCALMYAGFGIKDSISSLIVKQYEEILKYNLTITYSDDLIYDTVKEDTRINEYAAQYSYAAKVSNLEQLKDKNFVEKENININVIDDIAAFEKFVLLRKRNTNTIYQLDNTGIYITEKLAKDLDVKEGDTVYVADEDENRISMKISHIIEMYTFNSIYMTKEYYQEVTGNDYNNNCIIANVHNSNEELESQIGSDYLAMEDVDSITFSTANITKFENMIQTMNLVTYVLILSAAILSFIVLYNLTNVNISERIREIATIKVLGFYDLEVASYVYRENILISIIGALVGLALGMALHNYIMTTVEMDNIMFGNAVKLPSFIYSVVLTIVFSMIVNVVMYGKLRRVKMVESLKSIE